MSELSPITLAIHQWIKDDAPVSMKMTITPALVSALSDRIDAARAEGPAPVSAPLDREGVARIIDPDGFARREQHLRVSAEWHEKAEKFAATENPAPYPDGRFAVERIVEAWRGVAEKHATYAETDVRHAYAKADAILALSQQVGLTTPAASTDGAR